MHPVEDIYIQVSVPLIASQHITVSSCDPALTLIVAAKQNFQEKKR